MDGARSGGDEKGEEKEGSRGNPACPMLLLELAGSFRARWRKSPTSHVSPLKASRIPLCSPRLVLYVRNSTPIARAILYKVVELRNVVSFLNQSLSDQRTHRSCCDSGAGYAVDLPCGKAISVRVIFVKMQQGLQRFFLNWSGGSQIDAECPKVISAVNSCDRNCVNEKKKKKKKEGADFRPL